jgi:hypothetical protein
MITYTPGPGLWGTLAKSWQKSLKSDNKSENTIRIYLDAGIGCHASRKFGAARQRGCLTSSSEVCV